MMNYYSTNNHHNISSLEDVLTKGLASDGGLFMPSYIPNLPITFFKNIMSMSFQQMSFFVAKAFFGDHILDQPLKELVYETLSFETPIVEVENKIYSLELFHGPTMAFKDVGARFMARILQHFLKKRSDKKIKVLVATSGDTGSAVANGFLGVKDIQVYVIYPKGKVSNIQESQFTTLGQNITAIEVDGTFDDCQNIVKTAFLDKELTNKHALTSANSINIARLIPQTFYYFNAYAQLLKINKKENIIVSVPSGNLGNLTAGLIAQQMGLPIKRFISANNSNSVFADYLKTAIYNPTTSVQTIANAMDVGNPSNFARILNIYSHTHLRTIQNIQGVSYSDEQIASTIMSTYGKNKYLLDPHGACGYQGLKDCMKEDEIGVFLETAHPAKFTEIMESIINEKVALPSQLEIFMTREKQKISIKNDYNEFISLLK